MKNIGQYILEQAKQHQNEVALRFKKENKWEELTYQQFSAKIQAIAAGLISYGIDPGDRIGIFSHNSPEWLITDFAVMSIGAVTVPLYATTSKNHVISIINNSQMRSIFVGDRKQLELIDSVKQECPTLEIVVTMGFAGQSFHLKNCPFSDLLLDNIEYFWQEMKHREKEMQGDDLATIIYTSGTTGTPKGVMLTHDNFTNQHSTLDDRFNVTSADNSLCFLPLSHVYERSWSFYLLSMGACNTILDDPKNVIESLAEVEPTVMVSAPRLYDKIYAAIMAQVASAPAIRQKVFYWAIRQGKKYWGELYAGKKVCVPTQVKYYLADRIVLKKLRAVLGGEKNFLSSGGAPLDQSVEEFFFCLGLLICQGYGLTETSPMLTCNSPEAFKFGTVGRPINDVEIKISEEGEIWAQGPNVTQGYFRNREATQDAFSKRWFKTGDIGHLDSEGYLVITDRLKDLIITAGGKNIAPQRIETLVGKDHYIDQLVVFGDKRKYITAIVIPAMDNLRLYAKEKSISYGTVEELIAKKEIISFYQKRIEKNSEDLSTFEKIQKFRLIIGPFDQERGEITPTLKVRRKVVAKHYKNVIDQMYQEDEK